MEQMKRFAVVTGLAYFSFGPGIYEGEKINCITVDPNFYYRTAEAACGNPAGPLFQPSMIGSNSIIPWLLR